jgi:hypothetical protein
MNNYLMSMEKHIGNNEMINRINKNNIHIYYI